MHLHVNMKDRTFLLQVLKNFLDTAEAEVRSLISLYSEVVSAVHSSRVYILFIDIFFVLCSLLLVYCPNSQLFPCREETQILCLNTLGRIQLGVLLNKVCFDRSLMNTPHHTRHRDSYSSLAYAHSEWLNLGLSHLGSSTIDPLHLVKFLFTFLYCLECLPR